MKLTIIAKGMVLPAITIHRGHHPTMTPAAAPAGPKRSVVICEPAFRPVGDPPEAGVLGRCLAGAAAMRLAAATH